jgi:sulfate transporter 4
MHYIHELFLNIFGIVHVGHAFSFFGRLGWLIRFISHSVISGFTTASAIVIGLSQIKYFLGYSVTRSSKIIPLIESIIAGIDQVCFLLPLYLVPCLILDPHCCLSI